jgi:hypothetical protein
VPHPSPAGDLLRSPTLGATSLGGPSSHGADFKQQWAIEREHDGVWHPDGRSDYVWFREQVAKSPDVYFDAVSAKQAAASVYRTKIASRQQEIDELGGYLQALDLPDGAACWKAWTGK